MAWRASAPKGSKEKPWIEIHFPEAQEVSRFRFSSNREYYFETDYLESEGLRSAARASRSPRRQPDGSWKEIGKTGWARELLNRNPELKKASERLHGYIGQLKEEGPRHSFVGRFQKPGDRPRCCTGAVRRIRGMKCCLPGSKMLEW